MAPVTEMLLLTLKPDADRAALIASIEQKLSQRQSSSSSPSTPTPLRAQYAPTHEDPLKLRLALDWASAPPASASPSASAAFLETPASALASPPRGPYYVAFEPPAPAVLGDEGKVAEMLHLYFSGEEEERAAAADVLADVAVKMQRFVEGVGEAAPEGFSGEAAMGWVVSEDGAGLLEHKGEMCRAFVLVLGWESVDAHARFRDTEDFRRIIPLVRGLEGLKGTEMCHVSFREVGGGGEGK